MFLLNIKMKSEIFKAVQYLRSGGVILYPCDTIWAMGCDATNQDAINKIYLISGEKVNLPSLDKFIHIKPHSDSEIAKILNNTDIFISTSYFDGFGLPPLEALYCGCIVLIPNIKSNLDFSNKQRKIIKYRMKNHLDLNKNLNLIIKNIDFYKSQKKLIINKKNFSEDYNSKKFLKFLK